jgi:hypothetical protein
LREHLRRGGCRGRGSSDCKNGASARIDHRLLPLSRPIRATDAARHLGRCGGSRNFERCFVVPQINPGGRGNRGRIADPNFKARLLALRVKANPLGQFIADEIAKWPKVIKLPTSSQSDPSQHSVTSDGRIPQRNVAFGSGAAFEPPSLTVRFALHDGHPAALPRTAAVGQNSVKLRPSKRFPLFSDCVAKLGCPRRQGSIVIWPRPLNSPRAGVTALTLWQPRLAACLR